VRSYASIKKSFLSHFSDIRHLIGEKTRDVPGTVRDVLGTLKEAENLTAGTLGLKLEGLKMLEIGVGQRPLRLKYFSAKNEATGIDYDPVPQGFDLPAYAKILKNGDGLRFLKTLGRNLLGVDQRSFAELEKQSGRKLPKRANILQANAEQLPFADATFDFVYSVSVFEHLSNPKVCLKEAVRVLKPGGGLYVCVHHYASEDGAHDLRVLSNERENIPFWAHLRAPYQELIKPNAYLNKIRLHDWESLFRDQCPEAHFVYTPHRLMSPEGGLNGALHKIRLAGELKDYSDKELLAASFIVLWKKPHAA